MLRFATLLFLFLNVGLTRSAAQSTVFVPSGGLTIGIQRWDNSFERNPLFQWHGALAIETLNNDNDNAALFAQIGYHVKGSTTRFRFFDFSGGVFQTTERYKFNNISLILGAKQKFALGAGEAKYFYFGGIRGDYTYSTNIDELASEVANNPWARVYYPSVGFMNRFMFGISAGAGIQLPIRELVGVEFKLSVHPDFTAQYNQPPLPNVIDPQNPGQNFEISARQIRNTAVELSMGVRLIRKVVYE
jgi:hypothetical protein